MRKLIAAIALMLPFPLMADHHIPNAVTADPKHYTVEFENDVIRVVRIKYQAGETSPMHSHYAGCVISLAPGEMTMTLPDGSTGPQPVTEAGQIACNDAGAHQPTSVGNTETEAVMVELKGRKTVN